MSERTVTIQTSDHGPVTVPEPGWCVGDHEDGGLRAEIAHQGAPVGVVVGTASGPRALLELLAWQDPFPAAASPHGAAVHVAVQLLDGDLYPYDVAGLDRLAADLAEATVRVREVARRLAAGAFPAGEGGGR